MPPKSINKQLTQGQGIGICWNTLKNHLGVTLTREILLFSFGMPIHKGVVAHCKN